MLHKSGLSISILSISIHVVDYMCIYIGYIHKELELKSKSQQTGTWSAPVWLPRRLCYRPAVFLRHHHLTELLFSQEKKIGALLKNVIISGFLFSNCGSLNLHNVKLLKVGRMCNLQHALNFNVCHFLWCWLLIYHYHNLRINLSATCVTTGSPLCVSKESFVETENLGILCLHR
jgi:hypothetical protein